MGGQVTGKDADGNELTPEEVLRDYAGTFVPTALEKDDLSKRFPATAARIIRTAVRHDLVSSGRSEQFHDIFGLTYKDGSQGMLAVAGLLADADVAQELADRDVCDSQFVQDQPFEIAVPLLTPREKATLDQHHPRPDPVMASRALRQLGFKLQQKQLDSFHRYYRHYPLFGEIVS